MIGNSRGDEDGKWPRVLEKCPESFVRFHGKLSTEQKFSKYNFRKIFFRKMFLNRKNSCRKIFFKHIFRKNISRKKLQKNHEEIGETN